MNYNCVINHKICRNHFTLQIEGEVSAEAAEQLARAHRAFLNSDCSIMFLDFSQMEYINSTGLALVLEMVAGEENDSVRYGCYGLTEHFKKIARMVGMDSYVTICDTREDAVATL